ncbi:hypothetical protein CR532_04475 (plasmid) [Candidatus Borreliella tachyglossi]|uniref:Uncharacterized protein n=1 Tax=Candidatus Borreliella tachyglossi TaxID=1964448 RepID=A0A2S1LYD2_9SPIR|nr:hypothetical protein [Candidatus Borreliella tachyglossi]AWG43255.1 hypothetical protein CR532_04475 [Candidatus Borreliella tachyglossi]
MKKLTIIFFVLATLLLACTQTPDTNPPATNPPATPDPLAEDGNAKDAKDQANEAPQDQAKSEKDAKDPADEAPQVQAEEEKTAKEKEALEKEKEAKEKEKEAKAPAGEAPQDQAGKVAKDPAGEAPQVQTEEEKVAKEKEALDQSITDLKEEVKKYSEKIASDKSTSASDLKSVDIISDTKFKGSQEDKKNNLYEALGYNKEVIEALGEVFKELKLSSKPTNKKTAEDVLDLLEKFTDTTHKVLKTHLTDQKLNALLQKDNAKSIIPELADKVTGSGFLALRSALIDDLHKHIKEAKDNKSTESKALDALKKIVDESKSFMIRYKFFEKTEKEIENLVK